MALRKAAGEEGKEAEQHVVMRPSAISCSVAYSGSEPIAEARHLALAFMADVRKVHGIPVSDRAVEVLELVVSELVTNTRKYAPGPSRLSLEVRGGCVEVAVWDSNPTPPSILPSDPLRIGQHGLSIVMAAAHTFGIQRDSAGKRITASIPLTDPFDG